MLLTLERELGARADALRASRTLSDLAARLTRLLGSLASDPPFLPTEKALLSRDGGVCPDDGSRLRFDPDAPFVHRCGRCGREVSGARHHRAWVTRYQVWLSERAIHLALLGALGNPALSARAAGILVQYAERYHDYPNEDNVLGPTRLFFSTYLESIWLLQLAVAMALLDASRPDALSEADRRLIRAMLAESAGLVASFDEGWSNRQVWNAAALLATGMALGDARLRQTGEADLRRLIGAVDAGGMWHEGENYHLFALRGFVLGAECARWMGVDFYADSRLGEMYAAPLATLLPDCTLPARGDAPYGVSVRQPRFAELWEIGRARTRAPRLEAILAALYDTDLPVGDDHGRAELAEQEENRPPARQRRDGLGWKALLWMLPEHPSPGSVHDVPTVHEQPRIILLRPDARSVVSLECGPRAGGHGHPDLLHLTLFRERSLLADFGTGSYVDASLHWYRSALAHNVPAVAGRGQWPAVGVCDGLDQAGPWSWGRVRADGVLGPGTSACRSLLVGRSWLLDVVTVDVPETTVVDLPLHPLADVPADGDPTGTVMGVDTGAGHESGYDRIADVRVLPFLGELPLDPSASAVLRLIPREREMLLSAVAPGPPGPDFGTGAPRRFLIRRASGPGRWVQLISWAAGPVSLRARGETIEVGDDGHLTSIEESAEGMTVGVNGARRCAFRARPVGPLPPPEPRETVPADCAVPRWPDDAEPFAPGLPAAMWELGEDHYRRSEQSHAARGGTVAEVAVAAQREALWLRVTVTKSDLVVRAPDAPDPALDNEAADIHSDGVQAYLGTDRWMGIVAVPDVVAGTVRVRGVAGSAAFPTGVVGSSRRTETGYEVRLRLPSDRLWRRGDRLRFTVTVNEMIRGRERRSGQLALAGGGWVWLRGDRESPHDAVEAEIA